MKSIFQEVLVRNPLLRSVFERARLNAIQVMDEAGYVLDVNEAFQHHFGYRPEDLAGQHTRVLFTEEDQRSMMPEQEIEKVHQMGYAEDKNYLMHKDGRCIWTSGESILAPDLDGRLFIVKFIQDIHAQKVMEKFLKESHEFSENVVATISDGLMVFDPGGKILKTNKWLYRMLRLQEENLEGKQLFDLDHPVLTGSALPDRTGRVLATAQQEAWEIEWSVGGDGSSVFQIKAGLLDGKLANKRILLVIQDITKDRKELAAITESEQQFRMMADAMPQKVWTANHQGYSTFFNHQWLDYTGAALEELKGRGWQKAVYEEDAEATVSAWQSALQSGSPLQLEHRLLRRDGQYRWHLTRAIPQFNEHGQIHMWIGTNTDIHDQKMVEEELEKRVAERTAELMHVNEDLADKNTQLTEFSFVSHHDLQEPLRKIIMFSDKLKAEDGGQLTESSRVLLDKILSSAYRMNVALRDVLDFVSLNKEEPHALVNLKDVLADVQTDLEYAITEKGAVLQIDPLPTVRAARSRMQQLFLNLLSNALKFTRPGVSPQIRISSREQGPAKGAPSMDPDRLYYEITVADNGIGFEEKQAEKIFGLFQRLHRKDQYPGTGIGLALCKRIVVSHGGDIWAEGTPGAGARFHVLLPVE